MRQVTTTVALQMAAVTGTVLALLVIVRAALFGYDDAATGPAETVAAVTMATFLLLRPPARRPDR